MSDKKIDLSSEANQNEDLLRPITEENPVGGSIRYDHVFDHIREARREDENLPQGIWEIELKKADWSKVVDLCQKVLREQAKDLQVAAWFAEARFYLEGLPGLAEGFNLIRGLSSRYWDQIHPQIEGDDLEFRLAPFEWINERLAEVVRFTYITEKLDNGVAYTWADVHDANVLDKNSRRHKDGQKIIQHAESEGRPTTAKINFAISQTSTSFFRGLVQQTQQALNALQDLEAELFQLSPNNMPSFYRIRAVLNELYQYGKSHYSDRVPLTSQEQAALEKGEAAPNLVESEPFQFAPIASRSEAYARLAQAAEFLLRTEPHSPAPYLVKRAVAWGNMSLAELFQELIQDEGDLVKLKQLLGVRHVQNKIVA